MKVIGDEGDKLFQGVENIQYLTGQVGFNIFMLVEKTAGTMAAQMKGFYYCMKAWQLHFKLAVVIT